MGNRRISFIRLILVQSVSYFKRKTGPQKNFFVNLLDVHLDNFAGFASSIKSAHMYKNEVFQLQLVRCAFQVILQMLPAQSAQSVFLQMLPVQSAQSAGFLKPWQDGACFVFDVCSFYHLKLWCKYYYIGIYSN